VNKEPAVAEVQFSVAPPRKAISILVKPSLPRGFLAKNVLKALKPPPFSVLNPMP
jgi:hypothetical protein